MQRYACGYILFFADGGPVEEQVLHIGTLEECERLAKLVPAVAYSGNRPVRRAEFGIVAVPDGDGGAAPVPSRSGGGGRGHRTP